MSPPLSGRGSVSHSMVGRYTQARQKGVKGQDSKILVTTGTIKRPLPCPVEGGKNGEYISQREKKNRARGKEKR